MPQPPFQTDAVQIEPGSGDTLFIDRDSADSSLRFVDALLPSGVRLQDLVGARNIDKVYLVGPAGDGAPYTTVQAALDAVPASSSAANPSVVVVLGGQYDENLVVEKDGVHLVGLGAVLRNEFAGSTVTVQPGPVDTPRTLVLHGLRIENSEDGEACVDLVGATPASGTATVGAAPLAAGDILNIGGTPLTGVAATRTSGSDNFDTTLATTEELATEIAEAINDPLNSFHASVRASASGSVVTITARAAGTAGNGITLIASTTPVGSITVSGPTLTGGTGASGSLVGVGRISVVGCELVAEGVGGFQVRANTVNNVSVRGGSWEGSSSTSLSRALQCAEFKVSGVRWANDIDLSYDTGADQPSVVTSSYEFRHIGVLGDVLAGLTGAGSLALAGCPEVGDVSQGGDRTLAVTHSSIGALALSDTTVATLTKTSRGAASVSAGTPTLAESVLVDSVSFAASASEVVTFDVPQPDTTYAVLVDSPTLGSIPQATTKTTASFTLTASTPFTGDVFYTVMRQL